MGGLKRNFLIREKEERGVILFLILYRGYNTKDIPVGQVIFSSRSNRPQLSLRSLEHTQNTASLDRELPEYVLPRE